MSYKCPECKESVTGNWCDDCSCTTEHECEIDTWRVKDNFYGDEDWCTPITIYFCTECGSVQDVTNE